MVICRKCNLMYRWLLQLSPGTGCKYSLLFFSMLVQFAPIPFWNMVVHTNALLGKAECFCDCSIIFILSPPPPPLFSLWTLQLLSFFIICVCECMFVWRGETHRHCTGWLFSWFIIINHCNDSFIQLVVTCVSGNVCVAVSSLQLILTNVRSASRGEDVETFKDAKKHFTAELHKVQNNKYVHDYFLGIFKRESVQNSLIPASWKWTCSGCVCSSLTVN